MTTLRLERLASGRFDLAIAELGPAILWRCAEGLHLDLSIEAAERGVRTLAFAGVRAEIVDRTISIPRELVAARGRSISPVHAPLGLDVVRVVGCEIGVECARLLRVPLPWWPGARARREECRRLLRGEEVAFRWSRVAWSAPGVLRDRAVRRVLRPAVFAGVSLESAAPVSLGHVSEGALARWAFS